MRRRRPRSAACPWGTACWASPGRTRARCESGTSRAIRQPSAFRPGTRSSARSSRCRSCSRAGSSPGCTPGTSGAARSSTPTTRAWRRRSRPRRRWSSRTRGSTPVRSLSSRSSTGPTPSSGVRATRSPTFLGTVSHELRTPLHSILVAAELVSDPMFGPLTEERARDLGATIQGSGRHLLGLIDDMVDLARIEAGRIDLRVVKLPLAPLLDEIRHEIAAARPRPGRRPRVPVRAGSHDPRRPAPDPPGAGQPARQCRQVLRAGRPRVGRRPPDRARPSKITVHDTGVGIRQEDLARIFEPFDQVSEVRAPGAGLGLAIARRLMELHGGRLTVTSAHGEGSTFTVSLPEHGRAAGAADRPQGPPRAAATGGDAGIHDPRGRGRPHGPRARHGGAREVRLRRADGDRHRGGHGVDRGRCARRSSCSTCAWARRTASTSPAACARTPPPTPSRSSR